MKKLISLTLISLLVSIAFAQPTKLYMDAMVIEDTGNKKITNDKALKIVPQMGAGWNLGNTLDATGGSALSSELSWGQPTTTKAMIDALAKSGIKTIRIPVSWSNHMHKRTYTVDYAWMERVKTVVDWAIGNGMYVILNSHHDCWDKPSAMPQCSGYYPNEVNYEESAQFLYNLWLQIGTTFNNGYDEHLIFETMNEPRLRGTKYEWMFMPAVAECREAAECLNKLNQVALDAIRETGGNNEKRFVMIPGLQAAPDSALASAYRLPEDKEAGRLIVSVHAYSPYNFAMGVPGDTKFTAGHKAELKAMFLKLSSKFTPQAAPVIIGEYGATNKNNLEDRVAWFEYFLTEAKNQGMTCCLWDNGNATPSTNQTERYGYFNRKTLKWYFPEIQKKIVEVMKSKK